jgi:hypothetical protein
MMLPSLAAAYAVFIFASISEPENPKALSTPSSYVVETFMIVVVAPLKVLESVKSVVEAPLPAIKPSVEVDTGVQVVPLN